MNLAARLVLLLALLCSGVASGYAADLRVRKSIDALTADELEAYIHAVRKIREKSIKDPTVEFSYAHMAGLHNIPVLFNGACMHWRHEFLPWHRAHLINYEDALRASDPPRTENVTIPYWDWSKKPTGKRYPVAFENDPDAVAAHYGRKIDPELLAILSNTRRTPDPSPPLFPWTEIFKITQGGTIEFMGTASNHGAIENPPHDEMHGFIGGDLLSTSSAANDLIFWSFHTFIDLVWWWRQQTITDTVPCQKCRLNGMRAKTALRKDGPTLVSEVINAEKQLGYTYEFTPDTPPPAPAAVLAARSLSERLPVLADLALKPPAVLRQFELPPPKVATGRIVIALEQTAVPIDLAYRAFVYLHPASVAFDATSVGFRNSYLVGHFAQFANPDLSHPGHAAEREVRMQVDLSAYPALSAAVAGPLVLSVAIHTHQPPGVAAAPPPLLDRNTRIGSASVQAP